jgi:tol-pal system protein YbgF
VIRASRTLKVILLTALSIGLSGCFLWTTRSQGNELEEATEDHEERLSSLEDGIARERQELTDEVNRAKSQVARLEEVLEKATKVVTRNSADLGLEVEQLREQIARLEGEIATVRQEIEARDQVIASQRQELDQQIEKLARRAGVDVQLDESEIPSDKEEHYAAAYRAYQQGEYGVSRSLFRAYVSRYERDDQADNAQYWIGKSYLRQERPANAIQEFRKVISEYPRADAVDETLWDMGNAFFALNQCDEARDVLNTLISNFRRSTFRRRARAKLREISNARTCQ